MGSNPVAALKCFEASPPEMQLLKLLTHCDNHVIHFRKLFL